jgi:transcriptional regulator with XRE-family HTH domain
MTDWHRVALRVRTLREELHATQEVLAKRLGIKQSLLSHYETGRTPLPVDVAQKLAKLACVSLDWLYGNSSKR